MNKFFDILDKYKFGIFASLGVYIAIFIYLQFQSFSYAIRYEPFYNGSYVEIPEEEIQLKPENILLPSDVPQDVKNMSRNANDSRESSSEEYFQNISDASVDEQIKKMEQEMYEEAGGEKTRAEIRAEMDEKRKELETKKNSTSAKSKQEGGDTKYAGNVMVDWSLREAHQDNNWFIRNPGYTCGYGSSGKVVVLIKVNQNGNVTSAVYDASQSSGANSCMIEAAIKYAKLSRFKYSNQKIQSGWISYTFVSQ